MEPEGSLPCSQQPAAAPHPKPVASTFPHYFLRSILILSSRLCLGLIEKDGAIPLSRQRNYAHFMAPERSLTRPQTPAIRPYTEPIASNLNTPILQEKSWYYPS
jgi:hypothetical protein